MIPSCWAVEGFAMVDRVLGQLSLADGLVEVKEELLDRIAATVDWCAIKSLLGPRSGPGAGNSSYPGEVLLRCLLMGTWYGLSDPALESQIRDRLSFRRFAGFSLSDPTPDHTTLWRFRQELGRDGLIERVFEEINRQLEAKNLILKRGTLIDASLIPARARPPRKAKEGSEGLSGILCARPVGHWPTKRSPKTTANCVLASSHSRGGRFQSWAARLRTRYSSFIAASSFGKWPLVRTARRSLEFSASMALVV
jgi:transposase